MITTIDNTQRKFLLADKGWNTETYICNMQDIVKCAKEFEANQPYTISHLWNGEFKKLSVKKVIEIMEANQLDTSFFKKTKPVYAGSIANTDGKIIKVANGHGYDYYTGKGSKGTFYDLVPEGQPAPAGGYYSKEHILKVKGVPDLFN